MRTSPDGTAEHDARPIREVLEGFEEATVLPASELRPGPLDGRPMLVAGLDESGTLWLYASAESGRASAALHGREAFVVCQCETKQVMMRGRVAVPELRPLIPLPSSGAAARFGDEVIAVAFTPEEAELWDHTGMRALRFRLDDDRVSFTGVPAIAS